MALIPRNINLDVDANFAFEPGMFSIPELHFLLAHAEEPPVAAFEDFDPHDAKYAGVMRARVEPVLQRLHDLDTIRKHRKQPWAGFEAIQDSIERFLLWHDRSLEIARRSRGLLVNPSQWTWDDTGRAHKYAIDADSGEMVRTEILDTGERKPFRVQLTLKPEDMLTASLEDVLPWVKTRKGELAQVPDKLIETMGKPGKKAGFLRCPICEHTEEFPGGNRQAYNGARGRMSRHMQRATIEVNRHRLLWTKTFK